MPSSEILAVLVDEAAEADEAIRMSLVGLAVAAEPDAFRDAVADYREQVQRLTAAAEALHLEGLHRVCLFVEHNLDALSLGDVHGERQMLFERWPQLVLGYLKAPRDGVYSREMTDLFQRPDWPLPLYPAAATELEQSLLALNEGDLNDAAAEPLRQRIAQPEDVVLDIPADVNPKLVDAFLTEGPQQAGEYSALIQDIIRGDGWVNELNECRRLIHSLKGAANTVGVRGVATLCHHVEDIFEHLVKNALQPEGELGKLLIKVADTLEAMFEALLGTGAAPTDTLQVLQNVLDMVNRIEHPDSSPSSAALIELFAPIADAEAVELDSNCAPIEPATAESTAPQLAAAKIEPKVRVALKAIDSMIRTSGEVTISSGHVLTRLRQAFEMLAELRGRHGALWDRSNDMESFVTTQGMAAGRRQALAGGGVATGFDALEMDQYSELHTYVHGLTETVADLQLLSTRLLDALTAVDTAVNQQTLLNTELHDLLMTSRMVPAGNLESRLQRTVRQTADQCGRQATLVLEGAEVMLDDQMVDALIDPLQHLLRNAVGHGLETPIARAALGKPETGRIELSFARDGNYVVIICRDDGNGLNLERIRAHAVERGLIGEEDSLTDEEIARLILRRGFSTAETLTEVSGRGVGMDIVHAGVGKLKGSIAISTQTGVGACFTLRVPMSLGIVHCLLAVTGGSTFALPTDNLEQAIHEGGRHVRYVGDQLRYDDGEMNCPAYRLARLVGGADIAAHNPQVERHVVLVNDIHGTIVVVVDAIVGGQDLVIKKLGRYLTRVKGVIGASILGDGLVVPILELADLLRLDQVENRLEPLAAARTDTVATVADILIVDDSLSVRTALASLLTEEGFRVRTAMDGVEAIEAIRARLPAIVIADLEMPRMNGLELTTHIRTNAATRHVPVIMVTSRTSEKHRKLAKAAGVDDYITKPYREQELLLRLRTILSKAA